MEYITLSWIDYCLFIFIFAMSLMIGVYFGCFAKHQSTTEDYLLGGKKLKVFPVSMSLVASTLSGVSLLGIPSEVYMHGMQFSMMTAGLFIMAICVMFIYLPVFYKLQLSSSYEYLELRFDKKVKILASVLYTAVNFSFMPVVIYAPSLSLNQMTGFNIYWVALIMSILCIVYTTIGGLKAIVWTDTLQFSITLCTLACVFIMGTISVGGISNIWNRALLSDRLEFFNMDPNPTIRNTFWTVVIGDYFIWLFNIGVGAVAIQRFLSVPTINDAKKILIIFVSLTVITKLMCCFSGLIMYAKYFDCDPLSAGLMQKPDQIVPFYVSEVAKDIPGLSGLFAAGLFTTALSTLSTVLNTISGMIYSDFLAPFLSSSTSEQKASNIIKLITVVIGLISVALIFVIEKFGSILELIIGFIGISGGPILGLVTLGMLFPFANKKGALFGGIGSFILMSLLLVKTQMYVWNGDIQYSHKPLDTHGCNLTTSSSPIIFDNMTSISGNLESTSDEVFWLFRISFHYYCMMGTLATIVIGLLVSYATRSKADRVKNIDLLSSCIHRFVKNTNLSQCDEVEKELQLLKVNNFNKCEYKLPESNILLKKI